MAKYALLRKHLSQRNRGEFEFVEPRAARLEELQLAHCPRYISRVVGGSLTASELRILGLPWSPQLVERSLRSVGATIEAATAALREGVAVSLAGGTHHAGYAQAEGYCVFNDAAIAARILSTVHGVERVLIVDADVHQGNGTAEILADYPALFTFSIHGERNFPMRKARSDLDIGMRDGVEDDEYLRIFRSGLTQAFTIAAPSIVIYLAGADPYVGDRLGRLSLTKAGLGRRDDLVSEYCRYHGARLVVVMAGGYAERLADVVDIHARSVAAAMALATR